MRSSTSNAAPEFPHRTYPMKLCSGRNLSSVDYPWCFKPLTWSYISVSTSNATQLRVPCNRIWLISRNSKFNSVAISELKTPKFEWKSYLIFHFHLMVVTSMSSRSRSKVHLSVTFKAYPTYTVWGPQFLSYQEKSPSKHNPPPNYHRTRSWRAFANSKYTMDIRHAKIS